jgi:hypothetical protein
MVGKSRLLKQIAIKIAIVYICLRELNDGYPIASPEDIDIFVRPPYRPDISAQSNEDNIVRWVLTFFHSLLQHLVEWCKGYNAKDPTQLAKLRKQLWLVLAEPKKAGEKNGFWETVGRETRKRYRDKPGKAINKLLMEMGTAWTKLEPFFSYTVNEVSQSMLLIIWDEARTLVNTSIDGRPSAESVLIHIFQLLCRSSRKLSRHGTPPGFPDIQFVYRYGYFTSSCQFSTLQ